MEDQVQDSAETQAKTGNAKYGPVTQSVLEEVEQQIMAATTPEQKALLMGVRCLYGVNISLHNMGTGGAEIVLNTDRILGMLARVQ